MKKNKILLISVLSILSLSNLITATTIEKVIQFDKTDLQFSKVQQYDIITMKELELNFAEGKPQLPFKLIHLHIPDGKKVFSVEIITTNQ